MTPNIIIKILTHIVVFVLGLFIATKCTQDKGGVSTSKPEIKTVVTVIHDTIPRDVIRYVNIDKPTLVTVYKDRIIPVMQPDSTPTLSVRKYSDSVDIAPKVKVGYTAEVTGVLNNIQLGFRDTRPEIRTTLQITNDITTKVATTGLYVGGFSSPNLSQLGVEAQIVMPRVSFGAGYNFKSTEIQPINKVQLHLGYNLFPVK